MSRQGSAAPLPSPDDPSVTPEQRWQALFGTVAPARLPSLVEQALAWKEQALVHGDVAPQVARDLRIAADHARARRGATGDVQQAAIGEHAGSKLPVAPVPVAALAPADAPSPALAPPVRVRRTRTSSQSAPLPPASSQLLPGARLVKAHGGRNHVVEVEEHGFRYEGASFTSLSAVAKHITGTHWNGLLFFGLRKRGTYPPRPRKTAHG